MSRALSLSNAEHGALSYLLDAFLATGKSDPALPALRRVAAKLAAPSVPADQPTSEPLNGAGIDMDSLLDRVLRETRGRTYDDLDGRGFARDVLAIGWRLLGPVDPAPERAEGDEEELIRRADALQTIRDASVQVGERAPSWLVSPAQVLLRLASLSTGEAPHA